MFEFPKSHRLIRQSEFDNIRRQGARYFYDGWIVYCADNSESNPRLGIVVSRRASLKATERNRLKRALRESFRQNKTLGTKDILCIAQRKAVTMQKHELSTTFSKIWLCCQKSV